MKLTVSNIAWDVTEDEAVAALFAELGISAVEIAPTKYWPAPCSPSRGDLKARRTAWQRLGVEVVSLQALLYGMPDLKVFGTDEEKERTIEYLTEIFDIGAGLGAGFLVFGSPKNRDRGARSDERAAEEALPFFRRLGARAQQAGVVLGIEPNAAQYNCNFLTDAKSASNFVRSVDHPNIRLHLDTGVMALNEESVEATLDSCRDVLCSLHASEPFLAPLGSGNVDHRRIGAYLRKLGYGGHVSIEMRAQDAPPNVPHIRDAVNRAIEAYAA